MAGLPFVAHDQIVYSTWRLMQLGMQARKRTDSNEAASPGLREHIAEAE